MPALAPRRRARALPRSNAAQFNAGVASTTAFVRQVRDLSLDKMPGMAETIDWLSALSALGVSDLIQPQVVRTLGTIATISTLLGLFGTVIGSTAVGPDGKLGTVGQVFLDDETGRPEWATVRTGLFGTKEAFVPLAEADLSGQDLRVPYDKDKVKGAPHVEADSGHLSQQEEAELYRYYGLHYSDAPSDSGLPTGQAASGRTTERTVGHDTSGPNTDNAMTRMESRSRERHELSRQSNRERILTC